MWNRIERIAQPEAEALTLAEVKEQLRIEAGNDDDKPFLERCIKAAREMVEGPDGAGISVMSAKWCLKLDGFPAEIRIPLGPVLSIEAIEYLDGTGSSQTLNPSDFQWRADRYQAFISPAYGKSWPATRQQYDAVKVEFLAGFPGTGAEPIDRTMIPESLRAAMLMLIAHWDANRETSVVGEVPADMPFGFEAIMNKFRVGRIA
ncbi:head-tail connector protein [Aminobacter sp. NyZ550]|uniref:head-tail connector protein n=1 Tax=Aminobacter sp. NyZ550 TaxID=2979870 RepID=UPI0021D611CB|nr:head-tail connector protein [Aminobacter sp. NyZ550]WAX93191.1 head-tail connector protein [Aminobacter sp. NyZ550]